MLHYTLLRPQNFWIRRRNRKYETKKEHRSTTINALWCWRKLSSCVKLCNTLLAAFMLAYSSTLKMEEFRSSETSAKFTRLYSVISQTVLRMHHSHCLESLKSHIILSLSWSTLYVISWRSFPWEVYILSTARKIPFSGTIIRGLLIGLYPKPFKFK
jgi:hypothetical protein